MLTVCWMLAPVVLAAGGGGGTEPRVLEAADYGVVADGATDDGRAIVRLVSAALAVDGPVRVVFPPGAAVFACEAEGRYLFDLRGAEDLTLDGGGCTFLLDPQLRFLRLEGARNVVVRRLRVDFRPLPFVDGRVVAKSRTARTLTVSVPPEEVGRLEGGPTGEDGEQAFFGMLWRDGPYSLVSQHYWIAGMAPAESPGRVLVHAGDAFDGFGAITPGADRISLPVPGIAHRYGPGACFCIRDNTDLKFQDVSLWSAPWFGFEVMRNAGRVEFRQVHIRPEPGSGRLMSLWRDGFHVKGNRASLLWEDCEVTGMNDDAFNISTHMCEVVRLLEGGTFVVRQRFPLTPIGFGAGEELAAVDPANRRIRGRAIIAEAEAGPPPPDIGGHPAAPDIRIRLAEPVPGLSVGDVVWAPARANPDTTLRRCRIGNSCRMQSPMVLEACQVTGLLWFHAEEIEGPYPGPITVRDCVLRRGRGNPRLAVMVDGAPAGAGAGQPPRAIHDVVFENNEVWGDFRIRGAGGVRVVGNHFAGNGAAVDIRENHGLAAEGNQMPGARPGE